jgi:orotate phosphoribosyltransferase
MTPRIEQGPEVADKYHAELVGLLRARSLRRGEFVLSSGRRSDYYIDARTTTMSGAGQVLIGRLGLLTLERLGWKADLVGGLTLGADPIAYAIAHAASLAGYVMDAFTVRKEAKAHGTGRRIEGAFQTGARVVIVEDAITTGESALSAAQVVQDAGGIILGILALVDREEGGIERIRERGFVVEPLIRVSELLGRS